MGVDAGTKHISTKWPDRAKEFFSWALGPIQQTLPRFLVCQIKPNVIDEWWIYVSVGASDFHCSEKRYGLEFVMIAPDDNARHIETLAIVSHFYASENHNLDQGCILNLGRPWLENSACSHLLLSRPYILGPEFEWCPTALLPLHRFLWLRPITEKEAAFGYSKGVESLEQLFDKNEIEFADVNRRSVV
jgi:hypothetical protein